MSRQGLSVGDRVRVYREHYAPLDAPVAELGTGIFTGLLRVHGRTTWFHPKQCRKLRPKKKPERLKRWIVFCPSDGVISGHIDKNAAAIVAEERSAFVVRMAELRTGEIPISRERLEAAFKKMDPYFDAAQCIPHMKQKFNELCAALGLPAEEAE